MRKDTANAPVSFFWALQNLARYPPSASPVETSRRTSRPVHRMSTVAMPRSAQRARRAQSACPQEKGDRAMKRTASATWLGDLKQGKGSLTTQSGALKETSYSFTTRFENGAGTNPEELIAAAHAGCFTMALSGQLGNAGMTPESLETTAAVTLEKLEAGFTITKIHLDVTARIPGADKAAFEKAADNAKAGCPISRLLKAEITMTARLLGDRAVSA